MYTQLYLTAAVVFAAYFAIGFFVAGVADIVLETDLPSHDALFFGLFVLVGVWLKIMQEQHARMRTRSAQHLFSR